jgi:hypothetical protein
LGTGAASRHTIRFIPATGHPLLGYLPLEALDLYPNPKKRVLEGKPAHGGKMITDLL